MSVFEGVVFMEIFLFLHSRKTSGLTGIFYWWSFAELITSCFLRTGSLLLVHVCVCVFISFHRRGFSWLKQNKCNARDQASDVVLRKSLCVKYIHHHIIDNHSRDLQASNCARVSIRPGGATRNKRQLLKLSENQR